MKTADFPTIIIMHSLSLFLIITLSLFLFLFLSLPVTLLMEDEALICLVASVACGRAEIQSARVMGPGLASPLLFLSPRVLFYIELPIRPAIRA